jgi:hypothetical protein
MKSDTVTGMVYFTFTNQPQKKKKKRVIEKYFYQNASSEHK